MIADQPRNVLNDLRGRKIVADVSNEELLAKHLSSGVRTVYAGFDPTAASLHVGHLIPLSVLRRFQIAGHNTIALIGGATGLIGDPSGKSAERQLNDQSVVMDWVERQREQICRFLNFDGSSPPQIVNNLDWTVNLDVISYLRDIGKHFSVNAMMQRDSVRTRLEREESGISYTEFSYMLLQAYDFVELAKRFDCTVQVGGSDQWGNILSGVDLVRRLLQKQAYAITLSLLTDSEGAKFGKTAGGAVWLDSTLTSPYSFYQYWMNTSDADMPFLVNMLSFTDSQKRKELLAVQAAKPELREAQRALAQELTEWVHGIDGLASATRITDVLFGGQLENLTEGDLEQLWQDGLDRAEVKSEQDLLGVMCEASLANSRGAARRLIESRSVRVNNNSVTDVHYVLTREQALFGRFHLIRRGKKAWGIVQHDD
ncbi:MAG: tyrosine--tRNA ligase [Gammaproteobacteria bacterium]|nr:tyrosine--tRNA ligase [Gammaproteobacteria bacterium]